MNDRDAQLRYEAHNQQRQLKREGIHQMHEERRILSASQRQLKREGIHQMHEERRILSASKQEVKFRALYSNAELQNEHEAEKQEVKFRALYANAELQNEHDADKQEVKFRALYANAELLNEHESEVHERAQLEKERFQSHMQHKLGKLKKDTERATVSRGSRIQQQSAALHMYNTTSMEAAKKKGEELGVMRTRSQERIHEKHSTLVDNMYKREAMVVERDIYLQKKAAAQLYTSHWARELLEEAAVKGKLPQIRPDVQRKIDTLRTQQHA
eukprot:gene2641-5016_t